MEPDARRLGAPSLPRTLAELMRVAEEQYGLVTRVRCLAAGLTDAAIQWHIERGRWVRLDPGVYLTVPGRDDWWVRAVAAFLAVDDAAWSHHTAAFVLGLVSTPPRVVDLLVGHDRRLHPPAGVLLHRRRNVNRCIDELTGRGGPRSRRPSSTCAPRQRWTRRSPCSVARSTKRLTTEASLLGRLSLRTRHPARDLLTTVLGDVADGAESAMEVRYVRDVERAHGLPKGQRQYSTRPDGSACHDIGYPEQRVLLEVDGRLGHEGPEARVRDGVRDRRSARTG